MNKVKAANELVNIAKELTSPIIVYAGEDAPESYNKSVFLAGPTPRSDSVESWRGEAIELFRRIGYNGVIFVPEPRDGNWNVDYVDNYTWERKHLDMADNILFWIPRSENMPAFTTNVEFGRYLDSGKVVLGYPEDAMKMKYLNVMYNSETLQKANSTLLDTISEVNEIQGDGVKRIGGERCVPLHIWNTEQFQKWYNNLKKVGNRLDDAKQLWIFRMPKKRLVFSFVLWVKVWIENEQRYKENEWIFSRTDISSVVLCEEGNGDRVVLVREFRSPGRTKSGFIIENPGGSSFKEGEDPTNVAVEEVKEETSIEISPDRLNYLGTRQVAGTLSTHKCHAYFCKLTHGEMENAVKIAESKESFGLEEDTEQTYIEVVDVKALLKNDVEVDWTTMGMILSALKYDSLSE